MKKRKKMKQSSNIMKPKAIEYVDSNDTETIKTKRKKSKRIQSI